ncbi:MAG: endolytic transglycosylase MltG [Clostridiaceae bacterium]|nr:endolytic transglycosylase MltG [Clostridiaceae bacterium]
MVKKSICLLWILVLILLSVFTAACSDGAAQSQTATGSSVPETQNAASDPTVSGGSVNTPATAGGPDGSLNASQEPQAGPTATAKPTVSQTTQETEPPVVTITIPEGYTMAKICLLLADKGVNTFDKLFQYAVTADFSQYTFLPAAEKTPNRCFRLEGYLFPDTYDFYINEKPESVWKKFLDNFAAKAAPYITAATQSGITPDQAVTIASLIEKEASSAERANISAVIRNRLAKSMSLDLDTTLTYYQYVIQEYASGDPTRFRDFYYTYNFKGLPAGAICNPGTEALEAATHPSALSALYFFTNKAGVFVYSDTYEDHQAKVAADQ